MPHAAPSLITPQQRRDADALVHALRQGDAPTVRAMLRDGVNPNVPNREGHLPVMASPGVMLLPDVLQALFDAGADPDGEEPVDRQGRGGRSLLVMAVCLGSPGQVLQVLNAGASLERPGARMAGEVTLPPLSWAVRTIGERHPLPVQGIVDTLLNAGASATSLTLLRTAQQHNARHHPGAAALAVRVAGQLLDAGAPLDVTLRQPTLSPDLADWLQAVEVQRQQRLLREALDEAMASGGMGASPSPVRPRL